jgi:hypothetical protein
MTLRAALKHLLDQYKQGIKDCRDETEKAILQARQVHARGLFLEMQARAKKQERRLERWYAEQIGDSWQDRY